MLRPIKRLARYALERTGVIEPRCTLSSHERRQRLLEDSFTFFRDMAALPNIASVHFNDSDAVVTLADGRHYLLDTDIKAARLFNVPFTGTFEPDETAFARRVIQPGHVCIDVGANFGWFTVLMSQRAGEQGAVHAFEPIRDTAQLLQRNVDINNCRNVYVNPIALDDTDATREIFVPDIGVSGSFALHEYRDNFDSETVTTMTLDRYVELQELPRIDFIKADIEGAELNMLRGAARTLARFHPVLMLEVQATSTRLFQYEPADLVDFLGAFGYRPHVMTDKGTTEPIESIDATDAYNFVFYPNAHPIAKAA
jgi:FkbM family methyltransferase